MGGARRSVTLNQFRLNTRYYFRVGTCQERVETDGVESCDPNDVSFASEKSFILSRSSQGTLTIRDVETASRDAAGTPVISGYVRVGETLTSDTSSISDDDGMDNAVFTHQWMAGGADIKNATGSSHTLTENERGKTIQVRVSFTDDDGNPESLTSAATTQVEPRADVPATGAPVIVGTARVGETLRANTSGISDDDGLSNVAYSYQWLADGSDIAGATARAYTLVDADEGAIIKVKVSFTDDAGHDEELTSKPTAPVEARPNTPATGQPTISGTAQVGETLTADTSDIADDDGLSNSVYQYRWLSDGSDIAGATDSSYTLTDSVEGAVIRVKVSFTDDAGHAESLTSAATEPVSFAAQQQTANSPATGQPTISGTAQVGETLTVDTSAIADEDGLTQTSFAYRWSRQDPVSQVVTDITAATGSSYVVTDADGAVAISVSVSFTDDAGNEESLTSYWVLVLPPPNSPATGAPTISGTALVGETLTADTSEITDQDGLTNVAYTYQWLADDADIAGATGSTYTLVDADEGVIIKVRVSFTDDAGNEESLTSAATATVEGRPNSPATGAPTISGTAQVGEALTAGTSGIADQDGLTNVAYGYQWLADGVDIAGATGSTYTLVDADEGAAIRVQVSFTDDAGHEESLTSAATDAVVEAEPTEPPAAPTGLTAAASHDRVVLSWDDPQDDSITGYVILRRNRATTDRGRVHRTGGRYGQRRDHLHRRQRGGRNSLHLPDQGHQRARGERALPLGAGRHSGSFPGEQPVHGSAQHLWHGAGGRDADGGHLRHQRR